MADSHGNILYLFERGAHSTPPSKVIEESAFGFAEHRNWQKKMGKLLG
jgi:acetyl/propionyl-CoA carboxylase alpha subunit